MALYCKVDCALDMNPKIRKAGRLGREVFLFLLRRNRMMESHGILPPINIDPDYLSEQLMMPREEAVTGCHACVTAKLINVTPEKVVILGWSDEWAREAKTPAERQADKRRRDKENELLAKSGNPDVTNSHAPNVTVTQEKKRKEKKREDIAEAAPPRAIVKRAAPTGEHAEVIAAYVAGYERKYGLAPKFVGSEDGPIVSNLLKAHGADVMRRKLAIAFEQTPDWPPSPWDMKQISKHWNRLVPQASLLPAAATVPVRRIEDHTELARQRMAEYEARQLEAKAVAP